MRRARPPFLADDLFMLFHEEVVAFHRGQRTAFIPYRDIASKSSMNDIVQISSRARRFACSFDEPPSEGDYTFVDILSLLTLLAVEDYTSTVHDVQVYLWYRSTRFCPRCAAPLAPAESETALRCRKCGEYLYPILAPATITAVTRSSEILLVRKKHRDRFSLIAGFLEPGETLEACAKREIYEETSVAAGDFRYLTSQSWPFPRSMMVAFHARYLSGEPRADGVEIEETAWFPFDALPPLPSSVSVAHRVIRSIAEELGRQQP